ncbi:hypothetical protein D3C76_730850 [compost metagenome]
MVDSNSPTCRPITGAPPSYARVIFANWPSVAASDLVPVTNTGLAPKMSEVVPVRPSPTPLNGAVCSAIRSRPAEALATSGVPANALFTADTKPARLVVAVFSVTGNVLAPRVTVKLSGTTSKLKRFGAALPVTMEALPGTSGVPGTSGS